MWLGWLLAMRDLRYPSTFTAPMMSPKIGRFQYETHTRVPSGRSLILLPFGVMSFHGPPVFDETDGLLLSEKKTVGFLQMESNILFGFYEFAGIAGQSCLLMVGGLCRMVLTDTVFRLN